MEEEEGGALRLPVSVPGCCILLFLVFGNTFFIPFQSSCPINHSCCLSIQNIIQYENKLDQSPYLEGEVNMSLHQLC